MPQPPDIEKLTRVVYKWPCSIEYIIQPFCTFSFIRSRKECFPSMKVYWLTTGDSLMKTLNTTSLFKLHPDI